MTSYKFLTTLLYRNHRKCTKTELGRKFFSKNTANVIDTRTEREKLMQKKINEYLMWYENFTGLSEVKMCQDRVIKAQEKLISIQEKRKQTNNELLNISRKRNDLQEQLLKINKGDPNYLSLVHQEHETIYEEKNIKSQLENEEREERDCFSYLSNTIRDSHEKQRLQADRSKYWMIFFTVLGPFLTYLLTLRKDNRMVHNMLTNISKSSTSVNLQSVLEKVDEKHLEVNNILSGVSVSTSELMKIITRTEKKIDENTDHFNSMFLKMSTIEKNLDKRGVKITDEDSIKISWAWSSYAWGVMSSLGIILCYLYSSGKH